MIVIQGVELSDEELSQIYTPHGEFNGLFIPDWLYQMSGLSLMAKIIFGRLARYAGRDGVCFPKRASIADEMDISERQVSRCITELCDRGLLLRKVRGKGRSNVYFFKRSGEVGSIDFSLIKKMAQNNDENEPEKESEIEPKPGQIKGDKNVPDKSKGDKNVPDKSKGDKNVSHRVTKMSRTYRNKESHLKRVTIENDQFEDDSPNMVGLYGKSQYRFYVSIPTDLEYVEFKKAYQEYLDYMKDQFTVFKSVMAIEKDFLQLATLKRQGSDPIEVLNQTIRSCGRNFYPVRKFDEPVKEVRGSGPNWGLM
jgi:hypothetical protein